MELDREEMARRLDEIISIHMLPDNWEEWPENFQKAYPNTFDLKTAGVQELTRHWVDYITGVTDVAK
jgi:hypothetical protein